MPLVGLPPARLRAPGAQADPILPLQQPEGWQGLLSHDAWPRTVSHWKSGRCQRQPLTWEEALPDGQQHRGGVRQAFCCLGSCAIWLWYPSPTYTGHRNTAVRFCSGI